MLGPPLDGRFTDRSVWFVEGWWSASVSDGDVIVPDGAVDVMCSPGRRPWVAGPDTGPRSVELAASTEVIGLRLKAGVAPAVLGTGVAEATDRTVAVQDLWDRAAIDRLDEAMGRAADHGEIAAAMANAVGRAIPQRWQPDPVAVEAMAAIGNDDRFEPAGLSPRQFRRRFTDAVGYGPGLYRRIVRLGRFATLANLHPGRSQADLAAEAGYHDESHLIRDCRALTGQLPSTLRP